MKVTHGLVVALTVVVAGLSTQVLAAGFTPHDILASDPTSGLTDPEFDPLFNQAIWQDADGNLWLADIDVQTGEFIPRNGMGLMLDQGLADILHTGNGPEFGYGDGERFIAYTRIEGDVVHLATARKSIDGTWASGIVTNGERRWRPIATFFGTPGEGRIVYAHELESGAGAISWRVLGQPESERTINGIGVVGGRWAGTQRAFVTWRWVDGASQLFWVDIDAETVEQITFEPGNKRNACAWYAPEFDEVLISATVDYTHVGIFRQTDGMWYRYNMIEVPSQYEFVHSPEPFVHNGHSFISVGLAESIGYEWMPNVPTGPAEIWITNIDKFSPFYRRVDNGETIRRSEPEPFALPSGPVVYFSQAVSEHDRTSTVRVANTGLGSVAAGDTDGDGFSDDADNCILHDNPDQRDTNDDGLGNRCDADLDDDCSVDFGDLALLRTIVVSGPYDPDADFDGDGFNNFADVSVMLSSFFSGDNPGPGPSALPNDCDVH